MSSVYHFIIYSLAFFVEPCCVLRIVTTSNLTSQNANLVLQAERDRSARNKEPTGEAESLVGRVIGRMGDRVARGRTDEFTAALEKSKKRYSA